MRPKSKSDEAAYSSNEQSSKFCFIHLIEKYIDFALKKYNWMR